MTFVKPVFNVWGNAMKKLALALAVFVTCAFAGPAHAEKKFSFELGTGGAYNFDTNLVIDPGNGEKREDFTAQYDNKPFEDALYYMMRVGMWGGDGNAWEIELIHHKLYLSNPPSSIQSMEMTHGYNLITINRAWMMEGDYIFRLGAGIVLPHLEGSTKSGREFEGEEIFGQEFAFGGPTVQTAVSKRFYITKTIFANLEGKLTASYAKFDMEGGGEVVAPNIAAHAILSFGFDYARD